jgi:predicted small lipoprotein YifL
MSSDLLRPRRRCLLAAIARASCLALIVSTGLAACGQKGPLFLPPPDEESRQQR